MYSSFEVADPIDELSVKYCNLYIVNGDICYYTDNEINLPGVNKFINNYPWRPRVVVDKPPAYDKVINLACISDNHWYSNIGHAFFDSLYPIYVALCKFNLQYMPFDWFTSDMSNHSILSHKPTLKFIKGNTHNYSAIDLPCTKINTFIAGTGSAGNVVMRHDYKTYGSKYDALRKFVDRMYSVHDISQSEISDDINTIWIDNKRYSDAERQLIDRVIKERGDINYIDYSRYPDFYHQLLMFKDVDIQITGPGTGMIYVPFLKVGGVNVNLGHIEHPQTNTARPNIYIEGCNNSSYKFPAYMEQSLCNACYWTSTLYYDRYTHNELEYDSINRLIDKAKQLVNDKVILDNRLNIDAQIFVEYCRRSPSAQKVCDMLTNKALFIEFLINEHPHAMIDDVDINLLRFIKDEYKFNRAYEYQL